MLVTNVTAKNVATETNETKIQIQNEFPEEIEEPGFEAIFAIAGLFAVVFLVRRD
ncbi:MAG: PGF-CTERM sorting domain-containing protein [Candidatus Pacebacteria bacterium]|nr:PGF-CTERM sorting domain-containing protein [Candidatus Paceibacterota bacterium]